MPTIEHDGWFSDHSHEEKHRMRKQMKQRLKDVMETIKPEAELIGVYKPLTKKCDFTVIIRGSLRGWWDA